MNHGTAVGQTRTHSRRLILRFAAFLCTLAALVILCPNLRAQKEQPPSNPKPPAPPPPGTPLSHDLSGVWMQYPDERVNGVPIVTGIDEKTRPPLTPWGQARFDAAIPFMGPRAIAGQENNPSLRCEPESVPKSLILPQPFEIMQIPGRMLMFFEEFHLWREIWTDGRSLPKDPDPSYLGYSVGKWEGDTFVVDTIGLNDRPWVDSFGNPRSEAMHLTERYCRIGPQNLEIQIIMDDPKAYTAIWTSAPRIYKIEPGWELGEFFCVIDEEDAYSDRVRLPAGTAPASPK